MARNLMTCLWYRTEALEAAEHYCAVVPDSRIDDVTRSPEGGVILVNFTLAGRPVMALNGNPGPTIFTDAASMVLSCQGQAELDQVWAGLLQGGGAEKACGWLADRFGVAWQIIPDNLWALMDKSDPEAAARVMQAVWQMVKIDIATLERARAGGGNA
jgi:predicted 3-demethylubiquinone-9 3-methyltransferase (glyoxalase superfamily)